MMKHGGQAPSDVQQVVQELAPDALARKLENLPKKMTNILLDKEIPEYEHQVRNYVVDRTLPNYDPDRDTFVFIIMRAVISCVVCHTSQVLTIHGLGANIQGLGHVQVG